MSYHPLNQNSWALIIGIDRYKENNLPPLETAERGARALADLLHVELGFPKNKILLLINQEATREAIQAMLTDYFTDSRTISENDRLIVYYAGHGLTRNPQSGGEKVGYLAPYDAVPGRWSTFIEMDLLERQAGFMPCKHVLFALDACFSGLALTRSTNGNFDPLQDLLNRPSRRVITAGSSDQPTSDRLSMEPYSAFTYFLIDGLRGAATRDGVLRAAHLGMYIQDQVRKHSVGRQTPQIGRMLGDQGGDFIFHIEAHARMEVWLQKALISASPKERLKAAYELWETIESSSDAQMVAFARQTLEGMQYDSDAFVKDAVRQVLKRLQDPNTTQPLMPTQPLKTDTLLLPQVAFDDSLETDPDDLGTALLSLLEYDIDESMLATRENPKLRTFEEAQTVASRPENFDERLQQALAAKGAGPSLGSDGASVPNSHSAPTIPRRPSKWNLLAKR
jgi:hypothetical protein